MVAPVAAAGAGWLSTWGPSILSGAASLFGGRSANVASAREAQRNRDFQLMMSNTAHQREIIDLRKAGLNPILSANKGASTGSGSMAPQHDPVTPAVHSAQAGRRLAAELQLITEQTGKTAEERNNARLQGVILGPAAAAAEKTMEGWRNLRDIEPAVTDALLDGISTAATSGKAGMDWLIEKIQQAPAKIKEAGTSAVKEYLDHFREPGEANKARAERQKLIDEWYARKLDQQRKKNAPRRREY